MNKRLGILCWGITGSALLIIAAYNIIRGGLFGYGRALLYVAPFIFILFIQSKKHWHVLILPFAIANQVSIPMYGLDKLSTIFLLLSASSFIYIIEFAISHAATAGKRLWEDNVIFIFAFILTARFIYDRPGFINLGMSEGGFVTGLMFVIAAWFYFTVQKIVIAAVLTRKQLTFVFYAVLAVCVHDIMKGDTTLFKWRPLGGSSTWMLCAVALSLLATSNVQQCRTIIYYATTLIFMLAGILSGYRSRLFFFLGQSLSISWAMKRLRVNAFVISCLGSLGLLIALSYKGDYYDLFARFLSLFSAVETSQSFVGGAYGWTDSFRGELYRLAWIEIRRAPLMGSGFQLSVKEAIGILIAGGARANIDLLALSGAYHNSVLVIAVKAGLPAALLFIIPSITIPIRFAKKLYITTGSAFRTWGVTLLAFWVANTGMLLVNGGPNEYFTSMIISGFMMGMVKSKDNNHESEDRAMATDVANADRVNRFQ
jgi:hypothetical protein